MALAEGDDDGADDDGEADVGVARAWLPSATRAELSRLRPAHPVLAAHHQVFVVEVGYGLPGHRALLRAARTA